MLLSHPCIFAGIATLVFCVSRLLLEIHHQNYGDPWLIPSVHIPEDFARLYEEVTDPVIIWRGFKDKPAGWYSQCGQLSCFFTLQRQYHHHPYLKGIIFYGTSFNITELELTLPRNLSVFWALYHEESPGNNFIVSQEPVLTLFNYTATFNRHSSFPLTTQYIWDITLLVDLKYFETTEAKNQYQVNESWWLAPVLYIQSHCPTMNDRDSFVVELSKYIRVDSYGACLHNRNLPPNLQGPFHMAKIMSGDLLHIVAKYKFMLALENGICEDYITEKLWRPLIAGTVPIYVGSPSVADWLPNNHSAILGLDFESPKHLAEYLHHLNTHDEEYNKYLSHKLESKVTNTRLIQEIKRSTDESFSCFICEKAHNPDPIAIATSDHYPCQMPVSILSGEPNATNIWLDSWFSGRCEAQVVRNFVDSGVSNVTTEEYNNTLNDFVAKNKCSFSVDNAKNLHS